MDRNLQQLLVMLLLSILLAFVWPVAGVGLGVFSVVCYVIAVGVTAISGGKK